MKEKLKAIVKILSIPLLLMLGYLSVLVLWDLFQLPKGEQLVSLTKDWFAHYGLWLVFVSALLEGTLILGQYYPGGLVIFLGVISAGHNWPRVAAVVAVVSLSFFIGYTIDYAVGKYGWYKLLLKFGLKKSLENAQAKLQKHQLNAVFFTYWEPNLASIVATAAGTLQIPLLKFSVYSAVGIIIWNTFWGALVASLGDKALEIMGIKWVLIVFGAWVGILLIKHYIFDKRKNSTLNIP